MEARLELHKRTTRVVFLLNGTTLMENTAFAWAVNLIGVVDTPEGVEIIGWRSYFVCKSLR